MENALGSLWTDGCGAGGSLVSLVLLELLRLPNFFEEEEALIATAYQRAERLNFQREGRV